MYIGFSLLLISSLLSRAASLLNKLASGPDSGGGAYRHPEGLSLDFPFVQFLPLHLLSPLRYARRRGLGFWLQRVLHSRVAFSPVVSSLSVGASARRTRGWWLAAVGVLGWKSRSFPLRSRLASMYCRWFAASGPRSHRP